MTDDKIMFDDRQWLRQQFHLLEEEAERQSRLQFIVEIIEITKWPTLAILFAISFYLFFFLLMRS